MRRNSTAKVLAGLAGFGAFLGIGWAVGASTASSHSDSAAAGVRLERVPQIELGSDHVGTPAQLTYEAPPGATPPAAPTTPPAAAPTRPGATAQQVAVLLPARKPAAARAEGSASRAEGAAEAGPDTDGTPSQDSRPTATVAARSAPTVIDLCAGDDPAPGCPEGVGGTVVMADTAFVLEGAEAVVGPGCSSRELDETHFAVSITSTLPGDFVVTPRSEQSGRTTRVSVTTSGAEVRRWEAAGRSGDVVTCVVVAASPGDVSFAVHISGVPADSHGAPAAELDVVVRPSLADHPPVIMRPIDDTSAMLLVGAKANERVDAVIVRRPDGFTSSSCAGLDSDRTAIGFTPEHLRDLAGSGFAVGTPFAGTPYPRASVFELRFEQADVYDVCLTWSRDLAPRTQITRHEAFVVQPPARPSVRMEVTEVEVHQPRSGSSVAPSDLRSIELGVDDAAGTSLCRTVVEVPASGSTRWCDLGSSGAAPEVRLSVRGAYRDGGGRYGTRYEGALSLQQGLCAGSDQCGGGAWLPVYVPGSSSVTMGRVHLQVTYTNPPSRASVAEWVWQSHGTFGRAAESGRDPRPQLDVSGTRFVYDRADPFHLTVQWTADRPSSARVDLVSRIYGEAPCRSDRDMGEVPRTLDVQVAPNQGAATFEVCPGSHYSARIRLESADDHQVEWLLGPGTTVPTDEHAGFESSAWDGGSYLTPTISIEVNFSTKVRLADWDGIDAVTPDDTNQPDLAHVDWWVDVADHSYSQSRRSGFIVENSPTCGPLASFDLAPGALEGGPLRLEVGARIPIRADGSYAVYESCRAATSEAIGEPRLRGHVQIVGSDADSIGVADLIREHQVAVVRRGFVPSGTSACSRCVPWMSVQLQGRQVP